MFRSPPVSPVDPAREGRSRQLIAARRRPLAALSSIALAAGTVLWLAPAASASTSPCADGTTPDLLSTVTCSVDGNYTLAVPAGTTSVDVDLVGGGGGAGYPARQHIGGNAAEVTGTLTLPAGTAYLYVIVGTGGMGDNHGTSNGGGASAILAEDSGHALLAKLAIAGGGGGGAYNGDGGDAGSPGNSDNAQAVSGPGQPGVGATGGVGGTGNYAPGTAGGSDNPSTLTVAAGGTGGAVPGGATGGGGAGGYAGGGGGGGSRGSILSSNVAGGGGGSSLASAYLGSASIAVLPGTGGVQLPGLVASDGATGTVTMTFDGLAVPAAPTGASAVAGDGQASVSFTAPASDGGSAITSYTVTTSPGGLTATCPDSPCVVSGLSNGTSYTFTVHATNANGDSPESSASSAVTPASVAGAPTGASAVAGDGQASVSFTAPASDGGSGITTYTVTAAPGGLTATCPASPCVITGLTNGTSYTFTVHATNGIGDSVESAASTSVLPSGDPNAPTGISAAPGDEQASVSFTAPSSNGGSAITSYTVTSSPGGLTATCLGSPCVVTGLTDGTPYTFTVHATNANGDSPESAASSAVTPASVAGAPTGASAVAGNGQASVSFTAPASDGGSPITGYTVTSIPGGLTATCASSPCVITGLANGTSYTFTVHATNAIGDSAESAASTAVLPVGPPAAPGALTGTATDTTVTVSFAAPAAEGAPVTGYEYSTDGGTTWTSLPTAESGSTVTGTITGLTPATSYAIIVRASNSAGDGTASSPLTIVTAPEAVAAPTVTQGVASAVISWTQSTSSTVTGYTVYANPGPATCTTTSIDATSCVIGATAGVDYTYTVVAHSPSGDSAASAASTAASEAAPTIPDTAPLTASATLTTTDGVLATIAPKQTITLVGSGFLPYSSVSVILYSTPVVLGAAVTDGSGDFTKTVTIPADLAAGEHNLVASGVDASGSTHLIRMPVTYTPAAAEGTTPTTPVDNATPTGGSLAETGVAAAQLAVWALATLVTGFLVIAFARRRDYNRG